MIIIQCAKNNKLSNTENVCTSWWVYFMALCPHSTHTDTRLFYVHNVRRMYQWNAVTFITHSQFMCVTWLLRYQEQPSTLFRAFHLSCVLLLAFFRVSRYAPHFGCVCSVYVLNWRGNNKIAKITSYFSSSALLRKCSEKPVRQSVHMLVSS